ncbi:MAG: dihydrodipicolinate reductase, partial [Planctomycetota bacterium]
SVILGLGINPGFLMDLLPAILVAPFPEPESIAVTRRVDIATRRIPLQEKVGLGLTVEEFQRRKETTGIGHRGLGESIHLLGAALGLTWEKVETDVEPVLAEQEIATSTGIVPRGGVIGMRNWGHAHLGGLCRVRLDLLMASGLEDPTDSVELLGPPPFPVRIAAEGGVPGDRGTAHVLCAALPRLRAVAPGLRTVLDLPGGVRGWWGSRSATPSA